MVGLYDVLMKVLMNSTAGRPAEILIVWPIKINHKAEIFPLLENKSSSLQREALGHMTSDCGQLTNETMIKAVYQWLKTTLLLSLMVMEHEGCL